MKKRLLILAASALAASLAATAFTLSTSGNSLFRANVKAMAYTISIGVNTGRTECYNMYYDESGYHTLICGICTYVQGKGETIGGKCRNADITISDDHKTGDDNLGSNPSIRP